MFNNKSTLLPKQQALLLQQLGSLLTAGISLINALDILFELYSQNSLRLFIFQLKQHILIGQSFTAFLQKQTNIEPMVCQFITVGEVTGNLDKMLLEAANYLQSKLRWSTEIKRTLFYPCFIVVFALCIALGLFLFIVPRFAELFSNSNVPLPFLTQLIFSLSFWLTHYGWYGIAALGMVPVIVCYLNYYQTAWLNKFVIHLPIYYYWQNIILARVCHQLALMVNAGINLLAALNIVIDTLPDNPLKTHLLAVYHRLEQGASFYRAMAALNFFPDFLLQFIQLGEQSGTLTTMLNHAATLLENQIQMVRQTFLQIVEPLIMIMLGVLIGILVIALYLPIFNLGNTL